MIIKRPVLEFVAIKKEEILADTGSGIHICQGNEGNFGEGDCTAPGSLLPYCPGENNFNKNF